MNQIKRYAVYFAPRDGAFATRAAQWLGRDATSGLALPQPDLPGLPMPLADLTHAPRRYGFHGTIRAPFRLAEAHTPETIAAQVAALALRMPPVSCDGLRLEKLEGFIALTPTGCEAALLDLAATVVEATNSLRAPLTITEIARRQPAQLSARQRALLDHWGYPFVMEEFRFHLTLTSSLPRHHTDTVAVVLQAHFAPVLPRPFVIEDLCLFGEDSSGYFHLLHRYPLSG
jgi:putative phosphonate metabolism protein